MPCARADGAIVTMAILSVLPVPRNEFIVDVSCWPGEGDAVHNKTDERRPRS